MQLTVRDFRPTDIEALVRLTEVAFSDESRLEGITPASQRQRLRFAAQWGMVPFRLLTALAGYQWALLVAEADGQVVGSAMFVGRQERAQFSSLAILPDYRRRGIGTALLRERLNRARQMGFVYATATVLPTNQASLGNLQKQGFTIYDNSTDYDIRLPMPSSPMSGFVIRSIAPSDRTAFVELERRLVSPLQLEIEGSQVNSFLPNLPRRVLFRWGKTQNWRRVAERDSQLVGFVVAEATPESDKGFLNRPILAEGEEGVYRLLQLDAAHWLTGLGKVAMRVTVTGRPPNVESLTDAVTWLNLAKKL